MKKEKKNLRWVLPSLSLLLIPLALLFACADERLKVVRYTLRDERIEGEIRLVMLSDLHRSMYGREQSELIAAVEAQSPDAVLLCGDIFDEHGEYEAAASLLKFLGKKYSCFYVSGNHEYGAKTTEKQIREFEKILEDCNIIHLASEKTTLTVRGCSIDLFGIEDANRYTRFRPGDPFSGENFYKDFRTLNETVSKDRYTILLCHRPEVELFRKSSFDLVLSGHCHGGQWRFPPFNNGIYAPGQGWFPKYAGGKYILENNVLIVGRGLCNTYLTPRVCNRPEVVTVILSS